MDPVRNPYAPGAGRPPAALAGREEPLHAWAVALERVARGRTAQPYVLVGLRGVGKTVLLSEFARSARIRDWVVAQVEAGAGKSLREVLGEALHGPLADLARPSAGQRLRRALKTAASFKTSYDAASGGWSFGLDLTESPGGGADSGTLETDLRKIVADVAAAAEEENAGLSVLIDEAQDLTAEEMRAVCAVAHVAGQEGWRATFAFAGLPSLPRQLAEAKSYAERLFVFERIEHLEPAAARAAIEQPALEENVRWHDDALDLVVAESCGYPYFLQQFGQDVWNVARGPDIDVVDARTGVMTGRLALDSGFFRARWDRATPGEKKYLRAMAEDDGTDSESGRVAARLGGRVQSFGPVRANLISKGLIYAPDHGRVAFTVPAMADFVRRQVDG